MRTIAHPARQVLQHPGAFAAQTLKAFRANQGLLLAGAVAYYALLSIVPLLILIVIALSNVIEPSELLDTLAATSSGWCLASPNLSSMNWPTSWSIARYSGGR
jgi:uncharacterized BrkB/YihY/UPF0761 family membrane protein